MKRLLIALFCLPFLIGASSCVKEGCTDEEAINYDAEADDNNGTCVYRDSLKEEFKKEEREVVTFSLVWNGDKYEGYEFGTSLEGRSVLLYMEHPDFSSDWVAMPFTKDDISYYYSEEKDTDKIWVYAEEVSTSAPALGTSGKDTTQHKAVILTNEYLEAHPEVEDLDYREMKRKVIQ